MNLTRKILFIALGALFLNAISLKSEAMDTTALAEHEVETWKAYYKKDVAAVRKHMTQMLKLQYDIETEETSLKVSSEFASVIGKFAHMSQEASDKDYKTEILPGLIQAYTVLKQKIEASWSPEKVAEADLTWWRERRREKTSDVRIVGKSIAHLYELLYGKEGKQSFEKAGYLKAIAAQYRDQCQDQWEGAQDSDWLQIQSFLQRSYEELSAGIKKAPLIS